MDIKDSIKKVLDSGYIVESQNGSVLYKCRSGGKYLVQRMFEISNEDLDFESAYKRFMNNSDDISKEDKNEN